MTTPSTVFKKGEKRPNQGKRGPNKTTLAIKEMITEALENSGGVAYLEKRANDPRTAAAFLGLVGKVLPLQIANEPGKEFIVSVIERKIIGAGKIGNSN
jgi:hypothetical protein